MDDFKADTSFANGDEVKYLPLYFYGLTSNLKQQAQEELFENQDTTETSLNELRNLIRDSGGERHRELPTSDEELMPFLRARKHNVDKAYVMYKKYFAHFSIYDDLFKNVYFASILKTLQCNCIGYLPKRDADGCFICIFLSERWNSSKFGITDIFKASIVAFMDILRCPITQVTGVKIIVDFSHLSLSHLTSSRPWHMKFVAESIKKSIPLRFKALHFLNHGPIFYYMWRFLKPLLSEKLLNRVRFHGHDLNSLHQYVTPSILPEELGGTMGPCDNTEWMEKLSESENFLTSRIAKFRAKRI